MIDNRPKKHRAVKPNAGLPPIPEEPMTDVLTAPPAVQEPSGTVRAKGLASPLLPGIGQMLPGLGNLGGLGVLPLILVVSALQRGRGQPAARPAAALPAAAAEEAPAAAPDPAPSPARKPRGSLRAARKPPAPEPDPPAPEPVKAEERPQARPPRPAPRPHEIRNLLNDLSGYLPGGGSSSAARVSRIMGIADELRSLDGGPVLSASQPADPLDRSAGLLNVLSRNMPFSGASSLGRASQVLSLVNTLKGSGGQGMGNLSGMAGMLGNMMGQGQQQEMKNVTPAQADGIKDTVNKLLSGMDDKQKNDLLDKAKDFLGKRNR